jgi:hypothetical protein
MGSGNRNPPAVQYGFWCFDVLFYRLRDTQTPDELDMEDDDVIDAMLFQVGGGR